MHDRLIAIVGSIDAERDNYDPALRNMEAAAGAAEDMGRELAGAGYRILVFSSSSVFIEPHVVKGYVASGKAGPGSVEVRYPRDRDQDVHDDFPEQAASGEMFRPILDTHPDWEASYYLSVRDVCGIILIGGGHATLVMGLLALANDIPLVAIGTFGGKAEVVWGLAKESPLLDGSQHQDMNRTTWSDESASRLVACLGAQQERRARLEEMPRRRARTRSLVAFGTGLVAVFLMSLGVFFDYRSPALFALCFFGVPMAAGVCGALSRSLLDYLRGGAFRSGESILITPVLGMGAGVVSAVAFVLAQLATQQTLGHLGEAVREGTGGLDRLILFEFIVAFVAGLTFDAVFGRLEKTDVVRTDVLGGRP